jgi:chromate transporter
VTDQIHVLLLLVWHFALLSLFAVGGGVSMLIPQMHQEFVLQYHLLDERSFTELLAVSQATPGPNFLLVPLIGFRVASWAGALASMFAFLALPVTITFFVGRLLHQHENEWIRRFRRGFRPLTGGLWIAAGIVVAMATDHSLVPVVLTIGVAAISLVIDIPPVWWCVAAGIAGYALA